MKNILYISDIFEEDHIYYSQVKPILKLLMADSNLKAILLSNTINKSPNKLVIKHVKGSYNILIGFFQYLYYRKSITSLLCKFNPDCIISRGPRGGLLAYYINKFLFNNSIKIINDVRGDDIDENKNNYFAKYSLKYTQKLICHNSKHIIVVSKYLASLISNYYNYPRSSISILPTVILESEFYFDEKVRKEYREKLGFNNKDIVLVYSGSFSKWQNLDFILSEFSKINREDLKLLILTTDIEKIKYIISKINNKKQISAYSAKYSEVTKYLQASDYGLLIRDNIPTNKASSPIKFGEYINSGLCVIMNQVDTDYFSLAIENSLNVKIIIHKDKLTELFNNITQNKIRNSPKIHSSSSYYSKFKEIIENISNGR